MRSLLILGAAIAVVASTAAAANFDINAADSQLDDVSTGTSAIEDCTSGLSADLLPGAYDATNNDWALDTVRVTSPTAGLATRCDGFEMTVVVERAGLATVVVGPQTVAATDGDVVDFAVTDVLLRPTNELSVLVDEPNL